MVVASNNTKRYTKMHDSNYVTEKQRYKITTRNINHKTQFRNAKGP